MKKVAVLLGAGSIGQAIIRRVGAGKHVVLADYNVQNTLAIRGLLALLIALHHFSQAVLDI